MSELYDSQFDDLKIMISDGEWIESDSDMDQIFKDFLRIGIRAPTDLFPALLRDMFHEKLEDLMRGYQNKLVPGNFDCDDCSHRQDILIPIKNNDALNLPRAIAVAIAFSNRKPGIEAKKEWRKIREGEYLRKYKAQREAATNIAYLCDIWAHEGQWTLKDFKKIQEYLDPKYQLRIYGAMDPDALFFLGNPKCSQVLNLYIHDDHISVIRNLRKFFECGILQI